MSGSPDEKTGCAGKKWAKVNYYSPRGNGSFVTQSPPVQAKLRRRFPPGIKPFKGGQCVCKTYGFTYKIVYNEYYPSFSQEIGWYQDFSTQQVNGNWWIYGPFAPEIVQVPGSYGRNEWRLVAADPACPMTRSLLVAGNADRTIGGQTFSQRTENVDFAITNIYRFDGLNDDCGDLPEDCILEISQWKSVGGNVGSFEKVFEVKGVGAIQCDGDCPPGTVKDKSGCCCCENCEEILALARSINAQAKKV